MTTPDNYQSYTTARPIAGDEPDTIFIEFWLLTIICLLAGFVLGGVAYLWLVA